MKDRTAFFPSETGLLTTNARRCSCWSSDSERVFILILGILLSATVFCRAQIQIYGYIPDASVTAFDPFTANQGRVFVIDTATNQLVGAPIPVGFLPAGVAVTPDGRYAYITNNFSGTISVIDTASRAVVNSINVASGPLGVASTPNARLG